MRHLSRHSQILHQRLSTESGVYGVIVISGLIAVSGSDGTNALRTLIFGAATILVFWAAHIFAGAVSRHGTVIDGEVIDLRAALQLSFTHAQGMLVATLIPGIILLLGALGVLEDTTAQWTALWVNVAILATIGAIAYRRKGAGVLAQCVAALVTASFGLFIIVVKAIVTH